MYLEIKFIHEKYNTITIMPITCIDEAKELSSTIKRYHSDENLTIKLYEKGKEIKK